MSTLNERIEWARNETVKLIRNNSGSISSSSILMEMAFERFADALKDPSPNFAFARTIAEKLIEQGYDKYQEKLPKEESTRSLVLDPKGRVWWMKSDGPEAIPKLNSFVPGHRMTPEEAFRVGAVVRWTPSKRKHYHVEGLVTEMYYPNGRAVCIEHAHELCSFDELTLVTPAPEEKE